jgi:hypothetical protein
MGQNAGFLRSIVRRAFLGARTYGKDEKHHESNLVWGPLGIGSSIVLTVIAAMKHDLRFLFFAAWPVLCLACGGFAGTYHINVSRVGLYWSVVLQ